MILLDTDILSATRRPERAPSVVAWLRRHAAEDLFISVVSLGEIEGGIARQERRNPPFANDLRAWLRQAEAQFSGRILPFDADDARIWGRLSARIGHTNPDLMIAAIALRHGMAVATRNTADFAPTGVRLADPLGS